MTGMKHLIFSLSLVAAPALAGTCPDAPDHTSTLNRLIDAVQIAQNEEQARLISNEMWSYWADAPDDHAQQLLDDGMVRRASFDLDGAAAAFDALIAYCPDYAEGYNQRAFVNFIRQDYAAALPDLERAVALSPRHIAAIAGLALTLVGLEREPEAAPILRAALELNPWLVERRMLPMLEEMEERAQQEQEL